MVDTRWLENSSMFPTGRLHDHLSLVSLLTQFLGTGNCGNGEHYKWRFIVEKIIDQSWIFHRNIPGVSPQKHHELKRSQIGFPGAQGDPAPFFVKMIRVLSSLAQVLTQKSCFFWWEIYGPGPDHLRWGY